MIYSNKDILNAWKFIESINLKSIPSSQKNFELFKGLSESSISLDHLYNIYYLLKI